MPIEDLGGLVSQALEVKFSGGAQSCFRQRLSFARSSLKITAGLVGLEGLEKDEPEKVVVEKFGGTLATSVGSGPLKPPPPAIPLPPLAPPVPRHRQRSPCFWLYPRRGDMHQRP
jgi:hypothetical protein